MQQRVGETPALDSYFKRYAGRGVLETNGSTLSTELKIFEVASSDSGGQHSGETPELRPQNSFRMLETTVIRKGTRTEENRPTYTTD